MGNLLFLATEQGVVIAERDRSGWREIRRGLIDHHVTSLIAREGVILAGTRNGVFRSDDCGHGWYAASTGLTHQHIRWLAFHPDISDREFAGTEPAGIFVSHDGAQTWRECEEVARLRDHYHWLLPYSPEAGCVRGFAFHGDCAYAAVEVGGVLRSADGGETWQLTEGCDGNPDLDGSPVPLVYPDVHSIHVHPSSPDLIFAPTGGGFYRSVDGGRTWTLLYDCYCRAVWVDPQDAHHMILGPADYAEQNGRIEETRDGGVTWQNVGNGLRAPWPRHMVERFFQMDDELWAVLSSGDLLVTSFTTFHWQPVLVDVKDITVIATLSV